MVDSFALLRLPPVALASSLRWSHHRLFVSIDSSCRFVLSTHHRARSVSMLVPSSCSPSRQARLIRTCVSFEACRVDEQVVGGHRRSMWHTTFELLAWSPSLWWGATPTAASYVHRGGWRQPERVVFAAGIVLVRNSWRALRRGISQLLVNGGRRGMPPIRTGRWW